MTYGVKFPEISVQLSGRDGNVFALIGAVSRALKDCGEREEAAAFVEEATSCGSYDEVLQLIQRTVTTR